MKIDESLKNNLIIDVENIMEITLKDETKESLKRCFEISIGCYYGQQTIMDRERVIRILKSVIPYIEGVISKACNAIPESVIKEDRTVLYEIRLLLSELEGGDTPTTMMCHDCNKTIDKCTCYEQQRQEFIDAMAMWRKKQMFIQSKDLTDEELLKLPKEEILKLYKNCYALLASRANDYSYVKEKCICELENMVDEVEKMQEEIKGIKFDLLHIKKDKPNAKDVSPYQARRR